MGCAPTLARLATLTFCKWAGVNGETAGHEVNGRASRIAPRVTQSVVAPKLANTTRREAIFETRSIAQATTSASPSWDERRGEVGAIPCRQAGRHLA